MVGVLRRQSILLFQTASQVRDYLERRVKSGGSSQAGVILGSAVIFDHGRERAGATPDRWRTGLAHFQAARSS
jgi:hypothetical protein